MAPKEKEEDLTTFRTPRGIYCYTLMSFGITNTRTTYQTFMTIIYGDMLHDIVECYADDLRVKIKEREHHLDDSKQVFDKFR